MASSAAKGVRRLVYASLGTGALIVGVVMAPWASGAATIVSSLVAVPASVTIDLNSANSEPNPQTVNVSLDSGCPNALSGGLSYGVAVKTGYDTSVVSVTGGSGSFQCGSGPTFTLTGLASGTTSVGFHPIVGNKGGKNPAGQQSKLGDTSVSVTVLDASNTIDPACGGTITSVPPPGGDPAAPGVANTYIGASDSAYAKLCKAHYGNASNWRGQVISAVAAWMPLPESLKDIDFPTTVTGTPDTSWTTYVTYEVDFLCGQNAATQPTPAPADLPGAHS